MRPEGEEEDRGRLWRSSALLSTVGLTLALSIGLGVGLGVLADRHWKTDGKAVVIGSLLGIAAGFRELFRALAQAARDETKAGKDGAQSRPPRDE